MLTPIIRLLNERLDALTWIERRGGLVQTATKVHTDTATNVRTEHRFPITDDAIGRSCFETGRYYEMLPNSKLKAVTFWQQLGDLQMTDQGPKKNRNIFRGRIRLVGWLNVPALGVTDTQAPFSAEAAILNALTVGQQQQGISTGPLAGVQYELKTVGSVARTPAIFQAYTLPDSALLYPVDYFALDFELTVAVPVSCLAFVPDAEVCEDHTTPDVSEPWDWVARITVGLGAGATEPLGWTYGTAADFDGWVNQSGDSTALPIFTLFNGIRTHPVDGVDTLAMFLLGRAQTGINGEAEINGIAFDIIGGNFSFKDGSGLLNPKDPDSPIYWPAPYGQEAHVKLRFD